FVHEQTLVHGCFDFAESVIDGQKDPVCLFRGPGQYFFVLRYRNQREMYEEKIGEFETLLKPGEKLWYGEVSSRPVIIDYPTDATPWPLYENVSPRPIEREKRCGNDRFDR